jgi:hypothetical protein
MILIYGQSDDPPLTDAVQALQSAGANFRFLDQAHIDREDVLFEFNGNKLVGRLTVAGETLDINDFRGIYARPLDLPVRRWDPSRVDAGRLLHEQLFEWLDVAPALVVNRPHAMQANASKPLQIQLIAEHGFLVPETLITNDESELRAFWHEHGRIIYKSISGVRSIVQEMDEVAAKRLKHLAALPTQFQQWIPGIDVRVHVVGTHALAAQIEGSVTDYRYADRYGKKVKLTAIEISPAVASRCVNLAKSMNLPLAGIDFRLRPDGEFVCFEVNPMPAYSYFESHTGLPISRHLAQLLMSAA